MRLIPWLLLLASAAAAQPRPGDVYREYRQVMRPNKDWRVTDPNTPQQRAKVFLPNPVLGIEIGDLAGALRAEALLDRWGGHPGTSDQKIRFNRNSWIELPSIQRTPPGVMPERFAFQDNPIVEIPLAHLREGKNEFEGTCGDQVGEDLHWGQWGWTGIVVRVYYDPAEKEHATGRIASPAAGETLGEGPVIAIETDTREAVERVEVLAYYEGYDEDGDGVFADWHRYYSHDRKNSITAGEPALRGQVGTAHADPFEVAWNTRWVPNQPGGMKLAARVLGGNGVWYATEEVADLSLQREDYEVVLYRPEGVGEKHMSRVGRTKTSFVTLPDDAPLDRLSDAALHLRTWNGAREHVWVNDWRTPVAGGDHVYRYALLSVAPSALRRGRNEVTFYSETEHHAIEVLWPGPALTVRYRKSPERFTLPIEISAGGVAREEATAVVELDFRSLLGRDRFGGAVVQVEEVDDAGAVIANATPFQYDRIDERRAELLLLLAGETPADGGRRFRARFGAPYEAPRVSPRVELEELADYQGQPTLRIATAGGTWFYQRTGAGFASLEDPDGADWISYRPGGGADGKYRGIPNLIHPESDFHPGGQNSMTRVVHAGPLRVKLRSRTGDGQWEAFWDIFARHARFTVTKAPREYWLLYEGTPAGKLDVDRDFWLLSDGSRAAVSESFAKDLPGPEWIAFGDESVDRVLYLAHHGDDDKLDQFYQMQGEMTVFGFGREHRCCGKYLTEVPAEYSVGFVESAEFETVKSSIAAVVAPLEVAVGSPVFPLAR